MGVSHIDVVAAVAKLTEIVLTSPPLGKRLVMEDALRACEDAHHLKEKPEHLLVGPALHGAAVDDLTLHVLMSGETPEALGNEPAGLPHAADV